VKIFIIEHLTRTTIRLPITLNDQTGEDKDSSNQLTCDANSWRHCRDCFSVKKTLKSEAFLSCRRVILDSCYGFGTKAVITLC